MKRFVSFVRKWIPDYAWIYLIQVILVNFAVFSLTQILLDGIPRYDMTLPLDGKIPFVPSFVLFYVSAFVQWGLSWFLIARESKETLRYYATADIFAKLLCLLFFVFYPTTMDRPDFEVTGLLTWGLKLIYTIDKPYNLFPSIHILASHLALRAAFRLQKPPKFYRWIQIPLSVLIFLSILLVKQHVVLDIPSGVIVCELGLLGAYLMSRKRKSHER